jgi:hypothetical protein
VFLAIPVQLFATVAPSHHPSGATDAVLVPFLGLVFPSWNRLTLMSVSPSIIKLSVFASFPTSVLRHLMPTRGLARRLSERSPLPMAVWILARSRDVSGNPAVRASWTKD